MLEDYTLFSFVVLHPVSNFTTIIKRKNSLKTLILLHSQTISLDYQAKTKKDPASKSQQGY